MKESDRYIKIVEWSDEDGCFVGSHRLKYKNYLCLITKSVGK